MKKTIPLILFLLVSHLGFGQAFEKDTKVVALGLGIGSSFAPVNNSNQLPGLSIQYEQGVWEVGNAGVISLGGYVGYKSFKQTTNSGNIEARSTWNYTIVGARSAFHFHGIENDRLDLYAGLMLGYYFLNYKYSDNSGFNTDGSGNYGSTGGFTIYGGARYYLADNIGVFGELGYGVSFLNVGGVIKF